MRLIVAIFILCVATTGQAGENSEKSQKEPQLPLSNDFFNSMVQAAGVTASSAETQLAANPPSHQDTAENGVISVGRKSTKSFESREEEGISNGVVRVRDLHKTAE